MPRLKKRFGQHLLRDKSYLEKIIDALCLDKKDIIVEIGSGTGVLTAHIAGRVEKVYAVEIERDILGKLRENITENKFKNVQIVEADFLKLDLAGFLNGPFKVIGNIPYNITSKILLKLFGEIDNPAPHLNLLKNVYLTIQLEVAKRIIAKPSTKEYSPLTILVQYFSNPTMLFEIPKEAFYPSPKVNSAFVSFDIKKRNHEIKNPNLLKNIIRISFQQRRKKVINALEKLFGEKNTIINAFQKLKLDPNLRAENLNFDNYLALANIV